MLMVGAKCTSLPQPAPNCWKISTSSLLPSSPRWFWKETSILSKFSWLLAVEEEPCSSSPPRPSLQGTTKAWLFHSGFDRRFSAHPCPILEAHRTCLPWVPGPGSPPDWAPVPLLLLGVGERGFPQAGRHRGHQVVGTDEGLAPDEDDEVNGRHHIQGLPFFLVGDRDHLVDGWWWSPPQHQAPGELLSIHREGAPRAPHIPPWGGSASAVPEPPPRGGLTPCCVLTGRPRRCPTSRPV